MTLHELVSYIDNEESANNSLQRIIHDFFAAHVDEMANGLKEFVQTYYPQTYQQIVPPTTHRPDWAIIKKVVDGELSLSTLSTEPINWRPWRVVR